MPAKIGSPAPDFSLPDPEGEATTLANFRGSNTLVVFIPFPFTGRCEGELCTLRDHLAELNDLDANVVAISCDTRFANQKWSQLNGFGFPVLSDFWPHGEAARAYGCFNEELGCAYRVTFVLDADGVVRHIIDSGSLGTSREYDEYVAALEAL
jgi:peroxiredoxin